MDPIGSAPANWSPAGAPVSGDSLLFPATASTFITNNDIPGLAVAAIEANGNYAITGLPLTISSSITVTPGATTIPLRSAHARRSDRHQRRALYHAHALAAPRKQSTSMATTLTVQGAGEVDVAGGVTGFASITVAPSAVLVVRSANDVYRGHECRRAACSCSRTAPSRLRAVTTVSAGGAIGGTGSRGRARSHRCAVLPRHRWQSGDLLRARRELHGAIHRSLPPRRGQPPVATTPSHSPARSTSAARSWSSAGIPNQRSASNTPSSAAQLPRTHVRRAARRFGAHYRWPPLSHHVQGWRRARCRPHAHPRHLGRSFRHACRARIGPPGRDRDVHRHGDEPRPRRRTAPRDHARPCARVRLPVGLSTRGLRL